MSPKTTLASFVALAILLTGDRQPQSRNHWEKMLKLLGPELFRMALAEYKAARAAGVKTGVAPGAYFNGFLKDKLKLVPAPAATAHP
jgi:hypothetical protein